MTASPVKPQPFLSGHRRFIFGYKLQSICKRNSGVDATAQSLLGGKSREWGSKNYDQAKGKDWSRPFLVFAFSSVNIAYKKR